MANAAKTMSALPPKADMCGAVCTENLNPDIVVMKSAKQCE